MNTAGAQLCDNQHFCRRKITLMHKRQRILCRYVAFRASKEFFTIHHYGGSSVQRMTGHTCRITPRGKKKKEQEKAVREGQRWCVGWRWIYLHISLRLRKTHPDTPRWEEEENMGGGERETEWKKSRKWRVQCEQSGARSQKPRVDGGHNTAK